MADKDINSSQFGNSTQFSVSIEFLTMKLNLFAVQAIGIADFCHDQRWCTFFKLVNCFAKRWKNISLFWPLSANYGSLVASLRTFWYTLDRPK